MTSVHATLSEFAAETEARLAEIEAGLAAPMPELEAAERALATAKDEAAAVSDDDPSVPALELVRRRRETAEQIEVAEIELDRLKRVADANREECSARLAKLCSDLEPLVISEADRRRKKVADALKELLGAGASRLPAMIENSATWASELAALQLPLRGASSPSNPADQLALLRRALAALKQPGPSILA